MDFREMMKQYEEQPITRQLLFDALKEYERPYDKIHELVKQGKLIRVKSGIFIPGPALDVRRPEPFLLANHLLGPSYVSLETALSHWGLIPERVYEISSATARNSKTYQTPAGRFSYTHIPLPYYSFGIEQEELTKKQIVLVATPEKALCDKIVTTPGLLFRSPAQAKKWLTEDMRIEKDKLSKLDYKQIGSWNIGAPKKESLQMLFKTLEE